MKYLLFVLLSWSLFVGCTKDNLISNSETVYIDTFIHEDTLEADSLDYIVSKGVFGCELRYPYLFINLYNQEHFISVYNLVTSTYIGDYFKRGNAGNEYLDFNIINQNNDSVFWVVDPMKRRLQSFCYVNGDDDILIEQNRIDYKINDDILSIFVEEDAVNVYKSYNNEHGIHYVVKGNHGVLTPFKYLKRNDLNDMLTMSDAINDDCSKIVSLTGCFDQIEIISLDGQSNISVTTSKKILTLEELRSVYQDDLPDFYISMPRCNDDSILLLHNNQKDYEFLLIDWSGKGIARYTIKEKLMDFSVDWLRQTIYGVTEKEKIVVYRLPDVQI